MSRPDEDIRLRQLKRDATRLKKATPGMTHSAALDKAAQMRGHFTYHLFRKSLKEQSK